MEKLNKSMNIHFTDKFRRVLTLPRLSQEDFVTHDLTRWYANIFSIEKNTYILTTNPASLLSVVIDGGDITHIGDYLARFLLGLQQLLDELGMPKVYENKINPYTQSFTLIKTLNRSVLGSMNDMVNICRSVAVRENSSPQLMTTMINETPYTGIAYRRPKEAFAKMSLN